MATVNDWDLENSDISNAYLNAPLKEIIYMEQPEGFNDGSGRVIQLNYSLYGLVQAGHNWNDTLNNWITSLGISRSKSDPCLYTKVQDGKTLLLTIHVDDLIYCGESSMVKWFKTQIDKRFKATHDGNLSWILGMKVERDRAKGELKISQERHINDILEKFALEDSSRSNVPLPAGTVLTKDMCPKTDAEKSAMSKTPYKELVGSLMFISTSTRPDISFAVGMLCRYMDNPGPGHWKAAKQVLKYLKNTSTLGLHYTKSSKTPELSAYVDADYAGDEDARKSTTGYIFYYGNCPVSWSATLQPVVATSSTYAEYIALASAAQECAFLRAIVNDMGSRATGPTLLREDNQGAIFLSNNPAFHKRSKHIDVRFHYIREQVDNKSIKLEYVNTADNTADILTKQLPVGPFKSHRSKLMGHPVNAQ